MQEVNTLHTTHCPSPHCNIHIVMSDNKAIDPIDPPTSPPRSVDETAPSNLIPTSACRGRKRVKIHDTESVKDLPTYQRWKMLKKNETLCIDRLVFKKNVEEDDERLRKYLVRKNNNVAKKKTKTENNQFEKDAKINNLSDQLREKEAINKDLSDQLREKEAKIKDLSDRLREKEARINKMNLWEDEHQNQYYRLSNHNQLLKDQARELKAEVKAKDRELKSLARELKAKVKAKDEELKSLDRHHKSGYAFGITGKVIPEGAQVSVVLCLLLHSNKSHGLIFMCHIL
jgi:hypothetical protein